MASFITQATHQLAPAFEQQVTATQSKIQAIKQLYDALFQGLDTQQQQGNQNIYENTNDRGILKSTITGDLQTALAQSILGQKGQLAGKEAGEIAGVNTDVAGLQTNQAKAIADLANALQSSAFAQSNANAQLALQRQELAQKRALANRQYALDRAYYS